PEILVLSRSVECDVARTWCDLRHPNHVRSEIAEHFVRFTRNLVTLTTSSGTEEQKRAFLLLNRQGILLPSRVAVDRGVCEYKCELELRNGQTELVEANRVAGSDGREELTEPFSVFGHIVDASQHLITNDIVVARECKTGNFNSLGRRYERLSDEQFRQVRQRQSLRLWKGETRAVIEWIVRERSKTRVPHQVWEEGCIRCHRGATLIAGTRAIWSDNTVVFYADRYGLCIAETVRRGMTTRAVVVVVQTSDGVKEQQPPEISEFIVQMTPESLF